MYHDSGDNVSWDINKNVINLSSPGDLFFWRPFAFLAAFLFYIFSLYPAPWTVRMCTGFLGSGSILFLSFKIKLSMVRGEG